MWWKLFVFGCLAGVTVAQLNPQMMMMMMAQQGGLGGGGGGGGGNSGGMDSVLMCRNTDNLRLVPCANWKEICDIISMQTYNMPNMLKCSALGVGCCIKDIQTMFMINNNAK
ncbi:hypothetical protein ACF0H5_012464 [Mactra antiquata]